MSATAIGSARPFVISYFSAIIEPLATASSRISASTRTSFSMPTTRSGSIMLTVLVDDAQAAKSRATRTTGASFTLPMIAHFASEAQAALLDVDHPLRLSRPLHGHAVEEDRVGRLEPLI